MTRNLLVAFAGVLSDEPRVQLCYVAAVVLVYLALFFLLLFWSVGAMLPSMQEKNATEHRETCEAALTKLLQCTKSENFEADAKRLIDESTAYDRGGLMNFISKMGVDPTSQASGTTDTISINKIKGNSNSPGTVSA